MPFGNRSLVIEELGDDSFAGVDIALFSAGSAISKRYAAAAVKAGAFVVDNSSAFRMDADVPLVVPAVNAAAIAGHRALVANPHCDAAITPHRHSLAKGKSVPARFITGGPRIPK